MASPNISSSSPKKYDAVLIPGGGVDPGTGEVRPWVAARFDVALRFDRDASYFIPLSRGTTHKPPPRNSRGFPFDESSAGAAYLLRNGLSDPARILLDAWSVDTIGNAFYSRQMLAEPMNMRSLVVVTNEFHMPRTRAIFEWIFALPAMDGSSPRFSLEFCTAPNVGLNSQDVQARVSRELASLKVLEAETIPRISSISKLTAFLHLTHAAYSAKGALDAVFPDEWDKKVDAGDAINSY